MGNGEGRWIPSLIVRFMWRGFKSCIPAAAFAEGRINQMSGGETFEDLLFLVKPPEWNKYQKVVLESDSRI